MFEISESTVRRYETDVLEADLPEPDLDDLEVLLVDEKSVRKGHGYVTVVLNGRTGELLHMAEGKKVIKGSRYLLMMGRENLDDSGLERLLELTRLNENLSTAYILKEEFRSIYAQSTSARSASTRMMRWCESVLASGIDPMKRFAKGILRDIREVTAFFTHRITSGRIEAFNNQIARVIHRATSGRIEGLNNQVARVVHRACAVRDLDYLFLRLRRQTVMR